MTALPRIGARVTVPFATVTQQGVVDSHTRTGRVRVAVWNASAGRYYATLRTVEAAACTPPRPISIPPRPKGPRK